LAAALSALVAADAPALEELLIHADRLDDSLVALLADGLARNMHLRALRCAGNVAHGLTRRFVRETLLPALRANASLRELALDDADGAQLAEAGPAVELVRQRAAQHDAAAATHGA
jgi:hypothetical protein